MALELRVLYIIDSLAPGGAETSLAALAPHLMRGGVDLEVAYFHDRPGVQAQLLEAGARLTLLGDCGGRFGRISAVRKLVNDRRPDLVHTTLFEADIAGRVGARLARTPVVSSLVMDSYGPEHRSGNEALGWRLAAAQGVDALTAQFVRRFHANSHAVGVSVRPRLGVTRKPFDVVHRGRDAVQLGRRTTERRVNARSALGLDGQRSVVLAVGRHEPAKGFDVLLKGVPALRVALPNVVVLIAGRTGNATEDLERIILESNIGDAVRFLGHRTDVAELMCAADVLAAPSRREGLPGALIEALALECPIVAADIPTIREVVGNCAGALVKGDQPGVLASALVEAVRDPTRTAMLAASGRQRFESQFTIEGSAAGMLAFYRRSVGHL